MERSPSPNACIYDRFAAVADKQGLCVAIVTVDQTITYVALLTAVNNCAAVLASRGVTAGHAVSVHFSRPELYLIALLAANRLGASVILATAAEAASLKSPPRLMLSDPGVLAQRRRGAVLMDNTWFAAKDPQKRPPQRAASNKLLYGYVTSGSTGRRKFLRVSERNILSRLPSQLYFTGEDTRIMSTIGSQTAISTEVHLATLLSGGSAVTLPPDPAQLPYYIDLFGVTTLLTTPLLLEDLTRLSLPREIYRTLERVVITGAAASRETIERAVQHMCDEVMLSYGSAEIGGTARFIYDADQHIPGIVGPIVSGIDVEIVDDAGKALDAGDEGTIRIRREGALAEYAYSDAAEEAADRFADGWFYPGDRGWFDPNGNLVIAGRDDNVVNAGGNKYALELIESEIEARSGLPCMILVGAPESNRVNILVVFQTDGTVNTQLVVEFVQKRFNRLGVERIFATSSLPMSEAGKKDRMKLTRAIEDHHPGVRQLYSERPGSVTI